MRLLVFILIFILFSGCKFKEVMDNNFQTESHITPMAPADTIAERFGNGRTNTYTLKIPLSKGSIGYFDIDEVLGNEDPNRSNYSIFTRIKNGFKRALFNLVVKLGIKNKMKFTTYFELPDIDKKYIESARVKKVFFTTEDCRPEETDCNDVESYSSNFNFVNTFFLNISSENEPEGITEEELIQEVEGDEFESAELRSFAQTAELASSRLKNLEENEEEIVPGNEINILKFANNVPQMNLDTSQISDEDRDLNFHISKDKKKVRDFFRLEKFSDLVRSANRSSEGVRVRLRRDALPSQLFERISADQSPLTQKMYILRLSNRYVEAKKYFEHERFISVVKDTTMIGRSLFVELYDVSQRRQFLRMLNNPEHYALNHFDLYKMETCVASNCLDLDALPVNMAPLLTTGKDVRIDTWIEVRSLGSIDFQYNGYIEVEVVLKNLPL